MKYRLKLQEGKVCEPCPVFHVLARYPFAFRPEDTIRVARTIRGILWLAYPVGASLTPIREPQVLDQVVGSWPPHSVSGHSVRPAFLSSRSSSFPFGLSNGTNSRGLSQQNFRNVLSRKSTLYPFHFRNRLIRSPLFRERNGASSPSFFSFQSTRCGSCFHRRCGLRRRGRILLLRLHRATGGWLGIYFAEQPLGEVVSQLLHTVR